MMVRELADYFCDQCTVDDVEKVESEKKTVHSNKMMIHRRRWV
jgi:hypothetical protein